MNDDAEVPTRAAEDAVPATIKRTERELADAVELHALLQTLPPPFLNSFVRLHYPDVFTGPSDKIADEILQTLERHHGHLDPQDLLNRLFLTVPKETDELVSAARRCLGDARATAMQRAAADVRRQFTTAEATSKRRGVWIGSGISTTLISALLAICGTSYFADDRCTDWVQEVRSGHEAHLADLRATLADARAERDRMRDLLAECVSTSQDLNLDPELECGRWTEALARSDALVRYLERELAAYEAWRTTDSDLPPRPDDHVRFGGGFAARDRVEALRPGMRAALDQRKRTEAAVARASAAEAAASAARAGPPSEGAAESVRRTGRGQSRRLVQAASTATWKDVMDVMLAHMRKLCPGQLHLRIDVELSIEPDNHQGLIMGASHQYEPKLDGSDAQYDALIKCIRSGTNAVLDHYAHHALTGLSGKSSVLKLPVGTP